MLRLNRECFDQKKFKKLVKTQGQKRRELWRTDLESWLNFHDLFCLSAVNTIERNKILRNYLIFLRFPNKFKKF